jgi:O-antigen/teichoic acid export membrane protein
MQQALTLITGVVIGRMLGSSGYGLVNIVRNVYLPLVILAPLGLDVALLKYVGREDRDLASIDRIVGRLRLVVASASLPVALITGLVGGQLLMSRVYRYPHFDIMLLTTLLALPIAADLAVLGAYYRSRHRPGAFALMTLYIQPVARVVLVGLAFFLAPTTEAVVTINTLQVAISALFVWGHFSAWKKGEQRDNASPAPTKPDSPAEWRFVRVILGDSIWMAVNLFVYNMMRFVDILVLGIYVPSKVVGAYAALSAMSQLVTIWPMAASQTLGPKISRHFHGGDVPGLRKELNDYIHFASVMTGFIFAGVAAFGDRLDLLFGKSFVFRPGIALLMPLGYMISATLGPTGFALSMTGRHREELAILLAGAVILWISCYVLIPPLGDIGAAGAVCLTFALINITRFLWVAKTLGFVPGRLVDFLPPLIALAVAYGAKALVDLAAPRSLLGLLVACGLYAAAYGALTFQYLLGEQGRDKVRAMLGTAGAG